MAKRLTPTALKAMTNIELAEAFDRAAENGNDRLAELILAETNRRQTKGPDRRKAATQRRAIQKDNSIGYAIRLMARELKLPEDSIQLVYPWGRKARTDSTVEILRKHWTE